MPMKAHRDETDHDRGTAGDADVERRDAVALLQAERGEEHLEGRRAPRVAITVVSRRRRLLDHDNVCTKFAIDGLRYAGIIANDDGRYVASLTVRQEKTKHPETVIIIEELDEE